MSVWYAKKIGARLLDNVRKTKKHRHHKMVGTFHPCLFIHSFIHSFIYSFIYLIQFYFSIVFVCSCVL